MSQKEQQPKKATLFTDPFGNSQLKYDIVLDDNNQNDNQINTIQYQKEALELQQPRKSRSQTLPRITVNNIQFLTKLSIIIFIFFPITGIPAVIFSQLMKREFYNCNYEKAIEYKYYAKILSYLTVLFAIIKFCVLVNVLADKFWFLVCEI